MKSILSIRKDKLNSHAQLQFLKQLLMMLENGFSLAQSLNTLPKVALENQQLLQKIANLFAQNQEFGPVLIQSGFSKTLATQIEMSLKQGTLLECLRQLTKLLELRNKQMKKIQQEISYPIVIMTLMGGLMIFMRIFLADFISDYQSNTSRLLFWVSLIIILGGFLGVTIYVYHGLKHQQLKLLKQIIKFPIIGKVCLYYLQYLMAFNLSMLVGNGFSVQKIIDFCLEQDAGSLQFAIGQSVQEKLIEGISLDKIIQSEPFLSKQLVLALSSGSDQVMLKKQVKVIEQNIFNTLLNKLNRLCLRIQPVCFLTIGLGVLLMYLKLLLPMYGMMQTI